MIRRLHLVLLITLIFAIPGSAQQFVNGSLEPSNPGAFTYCSGNPLPLFIANMGNVKIIDSAEDIYLGDSSCADGPPFSGAHFAGLPYNAPRSQTLIFKLDAQMSPGASYTLNFFYKKSNTLDPCPLTYGYSHYSFSADSLVGNIAAPTSTTWQLVSETITPKIYAEFIWVSSAAPALDSGITYVDSFDLEPIAGRVNEASVSSGMKLYPNPFSVSTKLNLSESVQLPCNLELCDMTGKQVFKSQIVNSHEFIINKGPLVSGMYLIKLYDGNHRFYCTKLIAE